MNYIATNIILLRKELNIKQSELADMFSIKRTTWASYESGKSIPPINIILDLTDYFDINVDQFVKVDLNKSIKRLTKLNYLEKTENNIPNDELNNFFKSNAKVLRKQSKYTQKEIGEVFGLPRTTWGSYESGKSHPNWLTCIKIAKYFNVSVEDLISVDMKVNVKYKQRQELSREDKQGKIFLTPLDEIKQMIFSHHDKINNLEKRMNAYESKKGC